MRRASGRNVCPHGALTASHAVSALVLLPRWVSPSRRDATYQAIGRSAHPLSDHQAAKRSRSAVAGGSVCKPGPVWLAADVQVAGILRALLARRAIRADHRSNCHGMPAQSPVVPVAAPRGEFLVGDVMASTADGAAQEDRDRSLLWGSGSVSSTVDRRRRDKLAVHWHSFTEWTMRWPRRAVVRPHHGFPRRGLCLCRMRQVSTHKREPILPGYNMGRAAEPSQPWDCVRSKPSRIWRSNSSASGPCTAACRRRANACR